MSKNIILSDQRLSNTPYAPLSEIHHVVLHQIRALTYSQLATHIVVIEVIRLLLCGIRHSTGIHLCFDHALVPLRRRHDVLLPRMPPISLREIVRL